MPPIWVLGAVLTGFFLCQFHGSLAGSGVELVGRSLLQDNDVSAILESDANQQGLQKRFFGSPCGYPAIPKHGYFKIIGRVVYYSCNRGFALIGKRRTVCMPNCRWQFPAPYCVAVYIGRRGPKGPQGPDGATGAKGENGQIGQVGWNGRPGAPGMKGAVGAPGASGMPGWPGPRGAMGFPGFRGINGHNGQPGRKGGRGGTGQRGRMGPMGAQGTRGTKGDTGPMGMAGANAIAPISAFSVALGTSNPSIGTPIIWQRTIYNGNGDFQASSGTFLCRVPGVYRFTYIFQIYTMNAYVVFRVNGVTVWSTFQSFNSYYEVASASLIISLNHGDKVWLEIKDDCNGVSKASTFIGHLISPCFVK